MANDAPVLLHALARALQLSAAWLRAEANAGRIPSLRAGRRRLFNVEAVRLVLLRRAACTDASGCADAAAEGQAS